MKKAAPIALLVLAAAVSASAAGVTIKVVRDPGEAPPALAGFVQKGDLIVSDGKYTAAFAASPRASFSTINYGHPAVSGYLLALVPGVASKRAETQIGVPTVRLDGKALPMGAASVRQDGAAVVIQTSYEGQAGLKLEVRTRYTFAFEAGRVDVVSEVRNAGPSEVIGLAFGLGASACQSYNFSPYNAKSFPRLNFRVWQRPDHALGWRDPNPVSTEKDPLPGRLRPGQAHRVSYSLVAGAEPVEVLKRIYALAGVKTETVPFEFPGFDGSAEVVVKEPATGSLFYRAFMDTPAPLALPLPRGTYNVRANLFPAVVEKNIAVDGTPFAKPLAVEPPRFGRLAVSIADKRGRPALGKISFIGLAPTPSPYFKPEDPVATGRGWEGAKNSVYPLKKAVDVLLPAGTYLVTASRGPEYTLESRVVEVFGGDNPGLEFRLEKAVDTAGLLGIDTHMHTQHSDGSMLVPERLKSAAGEGLDAAVSTDHNIITDYGPDLARLGLEADLAVVTGNEVTARTGSIHYNTFPNKVRPGEPKGGAIGVEDETPDTLFALSRSKDPGALVHVNHPRSRGLGYFLTYELESGSAAAALAPFSMDFDVMEVMNGAELNEPNRLSVEDFFHFLNRGYPVRAVGVSDSHGIDGGEPGYCRTYVLHDGPKGASLDQAALVKAIKEGRSFVSNGPVVSVKANGRGRFGDTVKAGKGRVDLDIRVAGAPWLDVAEVRLVVNGERREPLPMEGMDGRTVKYRGRARITLEKDAWVAVEVRGRASLFPVIQQRSGDGSAESAALPYALTNPVFFDVDGNGRFDPPLPEKVSVR
jgi:hypothetical protein